MSGVMESVPSSINPGQQLERPLDDSDICSEEAHSNISKISVENRSEDTELEVRQDSGLTAWAQVFACWLLFMNTWGLTNSFSILETYYTHTKFLNSSPSSISWIGSLQLFLTLFIGVFAGWFLDAGHVRAVVGTGIAFSVFGMLMTSLCTKLWQLLLAQGLCVGIGSGALAFTSAAVIPFYFTKRRMLAAGIVSTGSSIAGVVYPLMMRELFRKVGYGWAVRILAFVMLAGLLTSLAVLKPHTNVKKHVPLFKASFLKDVPYTLFIIAYAFMVAGVYVPYFYIQHYALDLGISEDMTFNVVSIMNAATFFGRFPYNYLADMYGGIAVLVPCCLATSFILLFWRFVHTLAGLIAISATYCFVTGGLVSLPAATIANLTTNKAEYGTRIGMGYTIAAIGALVGSPIAGAAKLGTGGRYGGGTHEEVMKRWQGAWFVAGGALVVATALMAWARILRGGLDFKIKL